MDCRYRRICIIGTTGAGKSSLAKSLSELLGYPFVEGDALIWLPEWKIRDRDEFRSLVSQALASQNWVFDGCYDNETMKSVWAKADLVIWLDCSRWRVHWQVFSRAIRNLLRFHTYAHGNRDTVSGLFFSKNSILLYSLRNYGAHREEFTKIAKTLCQQNIPVLRLNKPTSAIDVAKLLYSGQV